MAIVKYKNQSGVTYAYESTAQWDPEKKQSRPVRKYLGRVDPETGEIIQTKGKRGRPKKEDTAKPETVSGDSIDYEALYRECSSSLKSAEESISRLEQENKDLQAANRRLNKALSSIYQMAGDCIAD